MAPEAPLLHDDLFTQGVEPAPTQPSNVAKRIQFTLGDVGAGLPRRRDNRGSGAIRRSPCTRPISSPTPASPLSAPTGSATSGAAAKGSSWFERTAPSCSAWGSPTSGYPAEIGGGFGGKTLVYLEPLAVALAKKSGRPVKMVMTREEVFQATGPTSGGVVEVKLGATRDGKITQPRRCSCPGPVRLPARRSSPAAWRPLRCTISPT